MRQIEATKSEFIDKLKKELANVEERYLVVINQNCMVGEDFRTIAYRNHDQVVALSQTLDEKKAEFKRFEASVSDMFLANQTLTQQLEIAFMQQEDQLQALIVQDFKI